MDEMSQKCVISKSTAERLQKDIYVLLKESDRSTGKLGFDGGSPVFYENGDEARRLLKSIWIPVLDFLEGITKIEPSVDTSKKDYPDLLTSTEKIDMQTCVDENLIFVTEDILEAQICDDLVAVRRCGVAIMLMRTGHFEYVFDGYVKKMADWHAEPPLEHDLVSIFKKAYLGACAALGLIREDEANSVRENLDER